jgi:hypothetical protein
LTSAIAIAAGALEHNAVLWTLNEGDFRKEEQRAQRDPDPSVDDDQDLQHAARRLLPIFLLHNPDKNFSNISLVGT